MNKEAYLEKFKAQLDEWKADLDSLEAKSRGASADAKIRYDKEASSIRDKMEDARKKASEIQEANEDAWDHLRQGAEDAWDKVKNAMADAKAAFK
jgi:phage terminase small subunit